MLLYEKKEQSVYFVLYDVNGESLPGLTVDDIVFRYSKSGNDVLQIKTLTAGDEGNFTELGFGLYSVKMTKEETDTIGQFAIVITSLNLGPSAPSPLPIEIDPKHIIYDIVPSPILPHADVEVCNIYGNIRELGGEPTSKPMVVYTQILTLPTIIDGNFISSKPRSVFTDEDGLFKIKLVVGAEVRVEIPDAGIRRQFIVPNQTTANLKDLPSP